MTMSGLTLKRDANYFLSGQVQAFRKQPNSTQAVIQTVKAFRKQPISTQAVIQTVKAFRKQPIST